jgi:hypothetical protein
MKPLIVLTSFLAIACTSAIVQAQPNPTHFDSAGMYYWTSTGWSKLDLLQYNGTAVKGAEKAIFGVGPNGVWLFPDSHAPAQLTERGPVFYLKRNPDNPRPFSARSLAIVRLESKKDHREIKILSISGFWGTAKAGYDEKKVTATVVKQIADDLYSIAPARELEPGEYMLVSGFSPIGYDFGIKP